MKKANLIKAKAIELGFELVGIVPAQPVPDFYFFRWWLGQGYAATMNYLQRGEAKRGDPEKILPGVKSLICCGLNYYTGASSTPIASYVQGEDYHEVVGQRLKALESFIRSEVDPSAATKSYVDTGPVLERSYAAQAGLGWIGKNTCLINNGLGSYVFLGEVLTTLALEDSEYDRPALDQCGTCSQCLDACPTGAFVEPYVMDANRCISYLTIERRGEFSEEQSRMTGDHVYGCDICQEVCPYNDRIPMSPVAEFQSRPEWKDLKRKDLNQMTEEEFLKLTKDSAMDRIKFSQWRRNLKVPQKL